MPTSRQPISAVRLRSSAWAGVLLACLLVLAQAFLLQHQAEHLGTGATSECPVCVTGGSLDNVATTSATPVSITDGLGPAPLPFSAPPLTAAVRYANARAPPPVPRTA